MQAVITAAGLGTRMLPASKEIPKEMLPIPRNGELKPVIHVIFEMLYDAGVRDFIIVVGRGKRVIEDYFTPDWEFVDYLEQRGKVKQAKGLREFYSRVEGSNIAFVNQPQPRGFGDAVLRAEPFTEEEFMVVGADTVIQGIPQIRANSFLITEVEDPRPYGVVTLEGDRVLEVEEKPVNPRSRKVIVPYYAFTREIFRALRDSPVHEELQLTEGIRLMLRRGIPFRAVEVREVYDLGNIEGYLDYLRRFSLH